LNWTAPKSARPAKLERPKVLPIKKRAWRKTTSLWKRVAAKVAFPEKRAERNVTWPEKSVSKKRTSSNLAARKDPDLVKLASS